MAERKKTGKKKKEGALANRSREAGLGFVRIADDVVASIAMIAAREVEGVAQETKNGKAQSGSAKVRVIGKNVEILMNLVISYGHNIPETCGQIQSRVKTAVENMTGLTVKNVDIRIIGAEIQSR